MAQIHDLTAVELREAIGSGELSPVEVTDHYLARIDELNERLGAFITVTAELAREQARAAEQAAGEAEDPAALPPLLGLPMPIKDLDLLEGVVTTFGSTAFDDFVAPLSDHAVEAVRDAGAVITGKSNTPEFGLPCYTENDVAPPARSPWNLERSAGGSSGGAAAAVAGGLAPVAPGSDGGGSVRIPASACGLFGIKPTRGRISGGPIKPDLLALSTAGPLARDVADAALLLDAMSGNRTGDWYTLPPLPDGETFTDHVGREPGRLRIARCATPSLPDCEVHPDCLAAYEAASALLDELGHEVEDVELPFSADLLPPFETIWRVLATLHPVAPDRVDRLRPLTTWLRDAGLETSAQDFAQAWQQLQFAVRLGLPALEPYDAILTPTLTAPPAQIGYFSSAPTPAEEFERIKHFAIFTAPYNVTGQPAVNVPLYWTDDGLPIGVMLAGRMAGEATLISLSAQLEAARPWTRRTPEVW